jgi:hypothetical protein
MFDLEGKHVLDKERYADVLPSCSAKVYRETWAVKAVEIPAGPVVSRWA